MPWELNGNANTDPNTDFLGTTDQEPLVIKTNGNEAVRVDGTGNVGIGTSGPSSKLEIAAQDGLKIVGFEPFLTLSDSNSGSPLVRIQDANGDIVIFTDSALAKLPEVIPSMVIRNKTNTVEIHAQDGLLISGFQPFLRLYDSNSDRTVRIQDANGDVLIYTDNGVRSGVPAVLIKDG